MEVTYVNSRMCLTPDEQTAIPCLKFRSVNCPHCTAAWTAAAAWLAHCHVACTWWSASLSSHRSRRMQRSVTDICFIREYAVQFIGKDFHWEPYIRKNCCRIFRIRFPGISVPSKSSVTVFWRRSFPEHAVNYLPTYLSIICGSVRSLI